MTLYQQILWGSLYLVASLGVQIAFVMVGVYVLPKLSEHLKSLHKMLRNTTLFGFALAMIVGSHTVQVWLWAGVFVLYDVLPDWNSAIYFSLVTYTALGYGDIVLAPGVRIFAAFASVTGLLAFGISTAFLVALVGRIFNSTLVGHGPSQ